jgi:translation initiation factor IF-3
MIRATEVRLIGEDGTMLGVVPIKKARDAAQAAGVDLVEISPGSNPPVCRIYPYSKWKYENDQKVREKRRNRVETKEFKFNVHIGESDIAVKCRKINQALDDGDRVRVVVQMRGRERSHPEMARLLMDRIIRDTAKHGKIDGKISNDEARVSAQLFPKKH